MNGIRKTDKFYDTKWCAAEHLKQEDQLFTFRNTCFEFARGKLGNIKNKTLLEVGAGRGLETTIFSQYGARVTAVDISTKVLELLQKRLNVPGKDSDVILRKMDIHNLDFPDNSFDLIYVNSVLMHVEFEKVIKEFYRVLRPGGKLVFVEPLSYNPLLNAYRRFCSDFSNIKPSYITKAKIDFMFPYFPRMTLHHFYFLTMLLFPICKSRLNNAAVTFLRRICEMLDNLIFSVLQPVKRLAWMIVVTATK